MKHLAAKLLVFGQMVLLFAVGCNDNNQRMSPEELALIPYAQRTNLPAASGGMVLSVNGETVRANEIIEPLVDIYKDYAGGVDMETFKNRSRADVRDLVTDKIFGILVYQEGKKELGQNAEMLEKLVNEKVREFVIKHGNDSFRSEKELEKQGLDWDSFRQKEERELVSQIYLARHLPQPGPVTYGEMKIVYEEIKDKVYKKKNSLQIRIIDMSLDIAQGAGEDSEQGLLKPAKELVERIKGGEDFAKLAREYSSHYSKTNGGLWEIMEPTALAKPYNILVEKSDEMEVGEVAGPVEARGHVFILKLEQKYSIEVEPFENVQRDVENRIRYNRQLKVHGKLTEKLLKKAQVGNRDEFVEYCLEEIYEKCQK